VTQPPHFFGLDVMEHVAGCAFPAVDAQVDVSYLEIGRHTHFGNGHQTGSQLLGNALEWGGKRLLKFAGYAFGADGHDQLDSFRFTSMVL
jgi:hypothetical protein